MSRSRSVSRPLRTLARRPPLTTPLAHRSTSIFGLLVQGIGVASLFDGSGASILRREGSTPEGIESCFIDGVRLRDTARVGEGTVG